MHEGHEGGRYEEAGGVDQEGPSRAGGGHHQAAEGRTDEPHGQRPDQALQRVGLGQLLFGEQVGDDGGGGRVEEGVPEPDEPYQDHDVPDLQDPGQRQQAQQADGRGPDQVGSDQQAAAVVSVAEDPAHQDEHDEWQGPGQPNHGHGGRDVADLVHLPGQCDEEEAVAQERDERTRGQEGEVALRERLEDADATETREK